MISLFLLTTFATLTAFARERTAPASGDDTGNAMNPTTVPLFATGGIYETFQMTVGLGTPSKAPTF